MDEEIRDIFDIINTLKVSLDSPEWYFEKIKGDLGKIFSESPNFLPSLVLDEYASQMYKFSELAKSADAQNMFETLAYITVLVIDSINYPISYVLGG